MNNWFECKISYEKLMENGVSKKISELYLVDALSHAEAEARIIKEMEPYISGEYKVDAVRRINCTEIFTNECADYWWKAKVSFITMEEKSGAEKRANFLMIAQGDTIENAIETIREGMKGSMADYEILDVRQSNIFDIFIYGSH